MKSNLFAIENKIIGKDKVIIEIIPSKDLNVEIINYLSNDERLL